MENFIWLIFAHFIGDFAFQSDFMAQNKGKLWYVMLAHCFVWTACIAVTLKLLGIFALWQVTFLIVGHYLCDYWKCQKTDWKYIYYDQAIHLIQLLVVFVFGSLTYFMNALAHYG